MVWALCETYISICDRSILEMQCPIHWGDFNGGSLRHLGSQVFWLLSSHINSMATDSPYLKGWSHWHHVRKKSDGFDSMEKKRRKWLILG